MKPKHFADLTVVCFAVLTMLFGCAGPSRVITEPPPFPDGFMNARWGNSTDEVKKAIEKDGNRWYQDSARPTPNALYTSGSYLNSPATFSYFFTPKSVQLYRVDITLNDVGAHGRVRDELIRKFGPPSFSQPNVDHWSWKSQSLVILQKNPADVQISFLSGPYLILNQKEGA